MSKVIANASTLPVTWMKSSYSAAQSDCVETARLDTAHVAIRDSKRPAGPALVVGRAVMQEFVDGLRGGA
ncbi:DUF397 domain-containing protein [Streptomyces sp. NPDC058301]|uniref:DUF397 domain-containing protein n=1 Tax=Streptomyces sp. NPDC058301 TaxID=3346436 RepID=UPI0036E748AE